MYLKKIGRTSNPRNRNSQSSTRTIKTVAAIASLSMALGLTACTRDYTLAYLYVTTSKSSPGVIDQYAVDYQSGAIVQFGKAVAAGVDPVASVASPNAEAIYVVNQGDSTVQAYTVGGDGTLTSKGVYPTTGNTPTAIAIDTAGKFLFVTCKFQGANTSGAGAVSVFPVNSDNGLGAAANLNIGNNPVGVTIANFNATVYVVDQDPAAPMVQAFSEDTAAGTLTPVTGTTLTTGYSAGVSPSAIAEDPTGRFVYVTDKAANQLIGYVAGTGGTLAPMVNGPFTTGLYPLAVITDPRGEYIYVANYNANSISSYALNKATGTPSGVAGATISTDTGPVALALDPALGIYLYTANKLGSSVDGERLDANTGLLSKVVNTYFPADGAPTSVAIVANGSHPTQSLIR